MLLQFPIISSGRNLFSSSSFKARLSLKSFSRSSCSEYAAYIASATIVAIVSRRW